MGTSGVILFLLVSVSWLGMLATLPSFVGADAHGDAAMGVGLGFFTSLVFACLTWLAIGGLLLVAGARDLLPDWGNTVALVLVPASAAGAMAAFYLLSNPQTRWPVVVPVLAPLLLAGYTFALMRPSLRPAFTTHRASLTFWLLVAAVAVVPWPSVIARALGSARAHTEGARAQAEWDAQESERNRAANLEKLKAMPAGRPIPDWYPLLDAKSGVRAEALAALRQDTGRQAGIEEMLGYGIPMAMTLLPDLDLAATPALCQAAGSYLQARAKGSHLRKRDDPRPYTKDVSFHESLPGIRWLVAHGCNCNEGIAALDAAARTYLDSPDRQKLLADLAALRQQ